MSRRRNRQANRLFSRAGNGVGYLIDNSEIYNYYRNLLLGIASVPFHWEGLEDTKIDRWYLERSLVERGSVAAYEFAGELVATQWIHRGGQFTPYGEPTAIQGFTGWRSIMLPDEDSEFEIGYDRSNSRSLGGTVGASVYLAGMSRTTLQAIDFHARRLYEMEQTRRQNLRHQRRPFVLSVSGNGKTLETVRQAYLSLESFDPVVEVASENNVLNSIESVSTEVSYNGEVFIKNLSDLLNEALSELGISGSSNKKERMITAELDLNRQQDNANLTDRMRMREEFADRVNKRFGTNISVSSALSETDTDVIAEQSATITDSLES